MTNESDNELITAIYDLARITIALQGGFDSTAEAIRGLDNLGIPPARIAKILGIPTNHATSVISRAKKK